MTMHKKSTKITYGMNECEFSTKKVLTTPIRSSINISHPGEPPKTPSTSSVPSLKSRFPPDLFERGELVYSLRNPELFAQPPTNSTDKILRFDSRFESGNLLKAFHLGFNNYHLILEPDCNKSGSCQWFYFQIKNVRKDIKYAFNISGFHKGGGVFTTGWKVFVYSTMNAKMNKVSWTREGFNYMYGQSKKDDYSKSFTLQFQIKFPFDNDTVYLAYGVPYTYSYLLKSLQKWKSSAPQFFSHEVLCKSFGGRDCPLITITNHNIPDSQKEYLMFTGRCHPGESNGSVVLHGLIDFFCSSLSTAQYLRNHYIIKIVPMVCIDGVIEGYYRICQCGSDLNRMWTDPDPIQHPIVYETKKLLEKFLPKVYIDFHGHSRLNGTFAFGCPNSDNNKDKEKVLPKIISYISPAFSYGKCIFSIPPKRQSASRCVAKLEMGILNSYTIETSFGGIANGKFSSFLYDEGSWKKIGMNIGEAIFNLLTPEYSKIRAMAEKDLKINSQENNNKTNIKAMISSQSIKIATPMKNCISFQVVNKQQAVRQSNFLKCYGSIPLTVL